MTAPLIHLVVLLAALPLQIGLGVVNARVGFFTRGEIRFWGVVIFVLLEIIHLIIL